MTELDILFASFEPKKPVVRKAAAPISPLAKLQKHLDALSKSLGEPRIDLSNATTKAPMKTQRAQIVKFDPDTRRAITRNDPLADENLGTTSARAIRKAEDEVDLYSGFTSRSRITGEH